MRKRLFAVVLAVVLVSAAGSLLLAANKGAHHQVEGSDKKEIHVYNVTARTVFLDKDDSPTIFDAIKSGMKVRVKTVHKEKQRQILELEIRPDKK
jgi:hypothetical protein